MDLPQTPATQPKSIDLRSKLSAHHQSIAKHSKALKNTSGLKAEKKASLTFHYEGIPLLVSAQLLRKRNLGQIDLARLKKDREGWILEVGEVKSSEVGVKQMEIRQASRIISSQNFLAKIFGFRTKLIRIVD
jgi:hypothetical protein